MVRPYITSELVSETVVTNDIGGDSDLFDDGDHTIEISYNQAEYDDMIASFQDNGDKDWIRADVVIDGTEFDNVGLRLKGNSTLQSLRSSGSGDGGGGGGGGGGMTRLSEDSPEELPWLISFDKYEEGRAYQGSTEIALRPAASGSDVALNEAMALELTAESGQTTQDYGFTSVSVNGSDAATRIVLDTPDSVWADSLGDGVLYKARSSGSLDYLGDDPTEYEDSFSQINGQGAYDLQPVMTLLKFLNDSSDEEFAEELPDYLDTESFAEYLAMQEILSNSDAMDGPGNNYYLWYDTSEETFTVLSWDLNLALSGGTGGMGGDMPDMDGEMPDMPENGDVPGGPGERPEGDGPGDGPGGSGGAGGSGQLKERFLDNEEFYALYEDAYSRLYDQLIASGYAADTLSDLTARAEEAGDDGAASTATSITSALDSLTAEAPEPGSGMGGGGGAGGGMPPEAPEDVNGWRR